MRDPALPESPPPSDPSSPKGCQRPDLTAYLLVFLLFALGSGGQAAWQAGDPRIEVWAAWHEGGAAPSDPWGNPFQVDEAGIRSAGPNGEFEEQLEGSDDVRVPRVPPAGLSLYRLLGWAPWLGAVALALGWEGYRWLRKPRGPLQEELPLALVGGAVAGVSSFASLSVLASQQRGVRELLQKVGEGLFVPPTVAFGGTLGLGAALVILALRLRGAPEPCDDAAPSGSVPR